MTFRIILIISLVFVSAILQAQFAPPAGQPGTTAIAMDSNAIVAWAASCSIERGYVNMADTAFTYNGLSRASFGSYLFASGPADELVVSLGDRGSALLGFEPSIVDRPGPDFAVFENSFGDAFLELAFVEVSTDGQRFVRFPAQSLTQTTVQVSTFDTLDTRKIHNLAGKYRHGYGTPFDLADLIDSAGIDLSDIRWVRIVDAGGNLNPEYATYDAQGKAINDPWPTPFDTGGFDLDAIGVIHNTTNGVMEQGALDVSLFPNPANGSSVTATSGDGRPVHLIISDMAGNILVDKDFRYNIRVDISDLSAGIYMALLSLGDGTVQQMKFIRY